MLRPVKIWAFASILFIAALLSSQPGYPYENLLADKVLSFANPNDYGQGDRWEPTRIASVSRHEAQKSDQLLSTSLSDSRRFSGLVRLGASWDNPAEHLFQERSNWFYPGRTSLGRIQRDLVKLACLPGGPVGVVGKQGGRVLDDTALLDQIGTLVGDPRSLFSSFEILVDRSKYTVQLFGLKEDNKRTLLFDCRAGLGSSDYPTPKGTYYIVRIFDNKPLWIPPPDREWAWGQSPSRSVYGGHMMPLFSKQIPNKEVSTSQTGEILDHIAPTVKMVDSGAYRVHGTDSPWSVGSNQSHGCIRLLNSSVAQLADTLKLYVGISARGETANGPYVALARPVRLILF